MTEVCISIKVFILKMEIWKWVRNWKLECLSWSTLQTQFGTEPRKTASSCQHLIFSLPKTKRIESSLPKTKGTEFNKNTFKEGCVGMRCQDYLCLLVETISDRATILVENMIWRVHNFKYGPYSRWQNFVTSAAEYEVHIWNCELARWCFMSHTLTGLIFVTNITNYLRGEKIVMWRNFSFPCKTIVGKLKISPHVEKFQMSPRDRCGETWNSPHTSPHMQNLCNFYALSCGEKLSPKVHLWRKNDKYQVCTLTASIDTALIFKILEY